MRLDAHLLALGLVMLDLGARAVRIRGVLGFVQVPLTWRDAVSLNAWCDLASALTPMRLGGDPARLVALRIFQVPLRSALGGLVLEMAVATPVTILLGCGLVALYGREWWASLDAAFWGQPFWIAAGLALVIVLALLVWIRRRRVRWGGEVPRPRATAAALLLAGGTTAVSVACRIAILPVLVLGILPPGDYEAAIFGSFLLLFGQLLVPVPAGAGVVDAAFLGGVAGVTAGSTLLAWRFYTTGFGVALGALLLAWRGVPVSALGWRRWRATVGGIGFEPSPAPPVLEADPAEPRAVVTPSPPPAPR